VVRGSEWFIFSLIINGLVPARLWVFAYASLAIDISREKERPSRLPSRREFRCLNVSTRLQHQYFKIV